MPSVCLCAGHYYGTAGKRSPDETYFEYEFNWDIRLKIKAHLERCGIKVIVTRDKVDVDQSLANRVNIANNNKVDFYFSIHTNAAGNEGWYNSARGYSAHIYNNSKEGTKAANCIMKRVFDTMTEKYGLKNRGIVSQNLYVTRKTTMPAVLIEHAFHSSEDDVKLLTDQKFRRDMAELEARGICDYLNVEWVAPDYPVFNVNKTGVTNKNAVYVRNTANKNGNITTKLHKNNKLEIVEDVDDFYKIIYGESFAYIAKDDVTIDTIVNSIEKNTDTIIKKGKINTSLLNVRKGPGVEYNVLGQLKKDDTIDIFEELKGFYRFSFNGVDGYVSSKYVDILKEDDNMVNNVIKTGIVYASSLYVRKGPGTTYDAIGSVKKNDIIEIYSTENSWYKIKYNNGYGYVSANWVKDVKVKESESKPDVETKQTSITISELKKMGYTSIILE